MTEMAYREHTITLTLCEGDSEMSMGRTPRDDEEFDEWAHLCEKGLLNGHIDWDILYDCARAALAPFPNRKESAAEARMHERLNDDSNRAPRSVRKKRREETTSPLEERP